MLIFFYDRSEAERFLFTSIAPKYFGYLGEERSALNRTKLHEKVFSERKKFPAAKFNAVKNNFGENVMR